MGLMMAKKGKRVRIKLIKSLIGRKPEQRRTVAALGLKRINSTTEKELKPEIQGMINAISHMIEIEEL